MTDIIKYTSDSTFQVDALNPKGPILVDFYAEWCNPCKAIAQSLEEIATEFVDKISIVKMNIDENPITPPNYLIRSIPTLIIFKNGQEISRNMGASPKSIIKKWIENSIG